MTGSRRAAVTHASLVLEHVPDLVRYGSKPSREPAKLAEANGSLRTFDDAVAYAPNQVFIGNLPPEELWDRPRPWWQQPVADASPAGTSGEIMAQSAFYDLLREVDRFDLVKDETDAAPGALALYDGDKVVGSFVGDHELDESLSAHVLLENLSIKASGVHALRDVLARSGIDPASITHAIGCGEEAVGDRYQRGGGNMAKAIAEECGLARASAIDVKSFCAAPVHAMVLAAALIEAGIEQRVVVVAGGSLGKLGMKFEGALAKGFPILEDVLAGMAIVLEPADGSNGPVLRTDAVGRMPIEAADDAAGPARRARRRTARRARHRHHRRRRVRDGDPQPRDHRAAGRRRRRGPQLQDARRARRAARRADPRRHPELRAGARSSRVRADAGTHRERGPVAPARAHAHARRATCTERC